MALVPAWWALLTTRLNAAVHRPGRAYDLLRGVLLAALCVGSGLALLWDRATDPYYHERTP